MNKVVLIVLDGWGYRKEKHGNAIAKANPKFFNFLLKNYPHCLLEASEEKVGLIKNQMGSSEVGHENLGAGRTVKQELVRINDEIKKKTFFKNKALLKALIHAKKNNSNLHLMGLLSDGGVHSHIDHLKALLELCKKHNLERVFIHAFLDGRDVKPKSALTFVKETEKELKKLKFGAIASLSGRFYAMDRDNRWNRQKKAFEAIVLGKGRKARSSEQAIKQMYAEGITDEFILPTVLSSVKVESNDSVIFFNFRSDRARQLTRAFVKKDFKNFKRKPLQNLEFVCFSEYDKELNLSVAFPSLKIRNCLGEILSKKNLPQLRLAETEKFAHVTYFFNCGRGKPFPKEKRILVHSPKVRTYDLKPEMSAFQVKEKALKAISLQKFPFILINFANPDMVAHTGKLNATVKAVKAVDSCLKEVVLKNLEFNGITIVTADHGNAELMLDKNNKIITSHTCSKVNAILVSKKNYKLKKNGSLGNIAPTILKLLNLKKPKEMTSSLLLN
ncbi:MAG: 2,3-bisphosphoglycerate-independent phosphoglycerate mutase [archaeon]